MTIADAGVDFLAVCNRNDEIRLKLRTNYAGDESISDIMDVVDPKQKARLVWRMVGPGSVGNQPIQVAGLVLSLRPLTPVRP